MKTLQELFTQAYLGLASQGFQQSIKLGSCLYRGPNNLRCAIGWCIPDEAYDEKFEGTAPTSAAFAPICHALGISPTDMDMRHILDELQTCHDNGDTPEEMQRRLTEFALENSLTIPEVPQ